MKVKKIRKFSKEHRELQKATHRFFDVLWLYKLYHGGKSVAYWRKNQYKWLAEKLGIPRNECHMATMTVSQLKRTIDICAEIFAENDTLLQFADDMESGKITKFTWFKF